MATINFPANQSGIDNPPGETPLMTFVATSDMRCVSPTIDRINFVEPYALPLEKDT